MENKQITCEQWNELPSQAKEKLKTWALKHGITLELIPGASGSFDPVCDYAALLTDKQMELFLKEQKQQVLSLPKNDNQRFILLWQEVKTFFEKPETHTA